MTVAVFPIPLCAILLALIWCREQELQLFVPPLDDALQIAHLAG